MKILQNKLSLQTITICLVAMMTVLLFLWNESTVDGYVEFIILPIGAAYILVYLPITALYYMRRAKIKTAGLIWRWTSYLLVTLTLIDLAVGIYQLPGLMKVAAVDRAFVQSIQTQLVWLAYLALAGLLFYFAARLNSILEKSTDD